MIVGLSDGRAVRRTRRARLALGLAAALALSGTAWAQEHSAVGRSAPAAGAAAPARLPADQRTHQSVALPDRTLKFSATAGSVAIFDGKDDPEAEVAFIAYQLDDADRTTRPVTFVFNGGPGMASGWLQVGAVGPWRIPFTGPPSEPPSPAPNAETWLDFTDLVFVDPPGTGYSRVLTKDDAARKRLWSVNGDIAALAETIRRWLDREGRIVSPKYILGESYGGFRGPRLARALASDWGVGVSGLVLVSPLLDAHTQGGYLDPFAWVDRLPSEAAAARSLKGPVTRDSLADVEQYATGEYLTDFLRGVRDKAAVARMTDRVVALTGLDPAVATRSLGRIDTDVFLHESRRAKGEVGSVYDSTIVAGDPFPRRPLSFMPDPVLGMFSAPVTSAMVALYTEKLNWRPDGIYRLSNDETFRQWEWGPSIGRPESVTSLQTALALDFRMRVLIAHGLFDLVTPYFTTARMLAQLPDAGSTARVTLAVFPGGHMFYSEDASRESFRTAARALYASPPEAHQ